MLIWVSLLVCWSVFSLSLADSDIFCRLFWSLRRVEVCCVLCLNFLVRGRNTKGKSENTCYKLLWKCVDAVESGFSTCRQGFLMLKGSGFLTQTEVAWKTGLNWSENMAWETTICKSCQNMLPPMKYFSRFHGECDNWSLWMSETLYFFSQNMYITAILRNRFEHAWILVWTCKSPLFYTFENVLLNRWCFLELKFRTRYTLLHSWPFSWHFLANVFLRLRLSF